MDCKNLGGTLPTLPTHLLRPCYYVCTMYVHTTYVCIVFLVVQIRSKKATNSDLFGLGRSLNRDLGRDLSLEAATNGSLASRLIAVRALGFYYIDCV